MAGKAKPEEKIRRARQVIARYEESGCYTVEDWNIYAWGCSALGQFPRLNPLDPETDIGLLRSRGYDI